MYVLISHSRVNSSTALRLCNELRKREMDTWLDIRDLKPGAEEWEQSVAAAIEGAAGFIFLIGPPGPNDRWQRFSENPSGPRSGRYNGEAADKIVRILKDPAASVDESKLELGRQARQQALESFRRYAETLEKEDIKRAGIRALE